MNKRGQAAMEFLMTYGWALLIVLVAIAVLAAMGVFSGGGVAVAACILNPSASCEAVVRSNGYVGIQMTQGSGSNWDSFTLGLSQARVSGRSVCTSGGYTSIQTTAITFPDGSSMLFERAAACGTDLTNEQGKRFQANIIATYSQGSPPITHNRVGTLRTSVEA